MRFYIDKETEQKLKAEKENLDRMTNWDSQDTTRYYFLEQVLANSTVLPFYSSIEKARYYSKFRPKEQTNGLIVKS